MAVGSHAWWRRSAVAVAVLVIAGTLAAAVGVPFPVREPARTILVLSVGQAAVAVWWVAAAFAARGSPARIAVRMGVAAAMLGALSNVGILLGMLGVISQRLAYVGIGIGSMELPIRAAMVLAWPGAGKRNQPAGVTVIGVAVVALGAGTLFWDFLIRPVGGFPAPLLARLAVISWGIVLLALAVAAIRGSRREYRPAFALAVASLWVVFAASYVTTILPQPVGAISTWGSASAIVLWLAAGEALRAAPAKRPREEAAHTDTVFWPGVTAAGLLAFHILTDARSSGPGRAVPASTVGEPGEVTSVLVPAAATLIVLLAARELLAWRARRR